MKIASATIPSVWIACGGTGGHFMPGVVVGRALEAKGYAVTYWGEGKRIEISLCEEQNIQMIRPSTGSRASRWYSLQKHMNRQAKKAEPMCVLLFGGFSSFALGTWAIRKRVAIHLFEQNTVPGRVNRLLSHFAQSVYLTFPLKKYALSGKKQILTGNPVRSPVPAEAKPRYDVLILGGSQGAASLNQRLPALLDSSFKICHVCGPGREDEVKKAYPSLDRVTIHESHPNVPELLSQCRWVISRSGATSLSEMAAAGTATLTVPFPFAKDDHQRYNAEVLRDQGAVEILFEQEFDAKKDWLNALLKDTERAETLKKNILASGLADVQGARALAELGW